MISLARIIIIRVCLACFPMTHLRPQRVSSIVRVVVVWVINLRALSQVLYVLMVIIFYGSHHMVSIIMGKFTIDSKNFPIVRLLHLLHIHLG